MYWVDPPLGSSCNLIWITGVTPPLRPSNFLYWQMFLDPPLGSSCNLICITVVTSTLPRNIGSHSFLNRKWGLPQPRFASRTFKSNILSPYSKLVEWPLNSAFSPLVPQWRTFFMCPTLAHIYIINPLKSPHLRYHQYIFFQNVPETSPPNI